MEYSSGLSLNNFIVSDAARLSANTSLRSKCGQNRGGGGKSSRPVWLVGWSRITGRHRHCHGRRRSNRPPIEKDVVVNHQQRVLQQRVLLSSCAVHMVQDGLSALQYVMLPLLAQSLGLSYTQIGILRAANTAAMSALEVPAGILAERFGERRLLIVGLAGAALGYIGVAMSVEFVLIASCFTLAGAGAAFQHSLASSLLVRHFAGPDRRRALGWYNASGDAGKLIWTGLFTLLTGVGLGWHAAATGLALVALLLAPAVHRWLADIDQSTLDTDSVAIGNVDPGWGILHRGRFSMLCLVVYLDSVLQGVFLTFLGFILIDRGHSPALAAVAVTLALAGGMTGKFVCGYCAARFGDRPVFAMMQVLSAAGVAALLLLPAGMLLWLLPFIGLVVQGSTTITYGAAADLLHPDRQARGYSLVYSLSGLSGVTGPFAFGYLADRYGLSLAIASLVIVTLITVPMCVILPRSSR